MDTTNEVLSKHLYEVLDEIGASEFIRKKYWEYAMQREIPITLNSQLIDNTLFNTLSFYQVGSACEGTTTPGLNSDVDSIKCNEDLPVVDNLVESKQQGLSGLISTDDDIKAGYVCLQWVKDKCACFDRMRYDSGLQSKLTCRSFIDHPKFTGPHTIRNGPADTIPALNELNQRDLVYALRFRQIPRSANSWLHRKRDYGWPSQKQLKAMGSYGCFLVGVGHPHSDNKSIEWRISFSLQERDLMSSLNETQHKCYILLKIIKKDIIESKIGDAISSYHCKTSLFYTIENSQKHIWKDDNLILCARLCLIRILKWVKEEKCPNYFIPEENMFDKLSSMTLENIESVLNDIIESGVNFLYTITCDNLGELLKSKVSVSEMIHSLNIRSTIPQPRLSVCESISRMIYSGRNILLRHPYNTFTGFMIGAMYISLYLQNTNYVTEHTTSDVRMALDSIIPHIQLQYKQSLFSQYLSRGYLYRVWSKTFQNVISETSSDFDLISSKLSLASFYIHSEQLEEECQCILVSCETSLEPYVISVCGCHDHGFRLNQALADKLHYTDMSSKYFRRHCTTGCMVFHQSQVGLVHAALHYEMFRNAYTKPGSIFETREDYWLNWITVDSQTYLYFLQYLVYSKNKKKAEQETAVQKLKHVLKTDTNLGHKETALNLLGWICLQENDLRTALRFCCMLWKIRPFKNAAKWHMLIILSELIKEKKGFCD